MEELDVEEVQAQVCRQVEYTVLCENYDEEIADGVVEIITEVLCQDSTKMQIGAHKYPMELVQKCTQSLTYEHVCYVLDCFREFCENDPSIQPRRQYRMIYERYLAPQEKSV